MCAAIAHIVRSQKKLELKLITMINNPPPMKTYGTQSSISSSSLGTSQASVRYATDVTGLRRRGGEPDPNDLEQYEELSHDSGMPAEHPYDGLTPEEERYEQLKRKQSESGR